jgi:hypothetical protein
MNVRGGWVKALTRKRGGAMNSTSVSHAELSMMAETMG